jgi:hypothetical protein
MVVHACDTSTWAAEAGGSKVQSLPELHREFIERAAWTTKKDCFTKEKDKIKLKA